MPNERINELETRQAFQESTLQALSEALADQQRRLDELAHQVEQMQRQLAQLIAQGQTDRGKEPPPHY